MSVLIKGNTPIPCLKMEMFNTPNWSDDPSMLGSFELGGMSPFFKSDELPQKK
jgi:hypothetical protein